MEKEICLIEKMRETLPAAFGRTAVDQLLPGVLSSKTLANLDSAGEGPEYFKHGKKVIYERDSFLAWLGKRIRKVEGP